MKNLKIVKFEVLLVLITLPVVCPSLLGLITGTVTNLVSGKSIDGFLEAWVVEAKADEYAPCFDGVSVNMGLIYGTVTDLVTEAPIEGAEISTSGIGFDVSGEDGKYEIYEMPGRYDLEAHADGYSPFYGGIITIEADATISLDIEMDPISTSTSTTTICEILKIYGDNSEEVGLLRFFRDNVLSQTPEGRELIRLYYHWSPVMVKAMENDDEFKEDMKDMIDGVLELIREEAE